MKDSNIIKEIFENPALIKNLSMEKIDQWIEETPYVQYLHLLKALKLKSEGVSEPTAYHKSATVVTDRIRMNELLDKVAEDTKNEEKKIKNKDQKTPKQKLRKKPNKARETSKTESPKGSIKARKKKTSDSKQIKESVETTGEVVEVIEEEMIIDWDTYISTQDEDEVIEKEKFNEHANDSKILYKGQAELSEFSEWLLAFSGKNEEISEEQVDQSVSIDGAAISETLAKLMEQQGHVLKAIEMYEKLSLINPEKSTYFAALIKKLKQQ